MTYDELVRLHQKEFGMQVREAAPCLREKKDGEFTVEDFFDLPSELRVELIDGVLYHLNTPSSPHQIVVGELYYELKTYVRKNKGKCVPFIAPMGVELLEGEDTVLIPDVFVVCKKGILLGRQVLGAPDMVVEVLSSSTRKRDLGIKYTKYRKAGVREYWTVDLEKEIITVSIFEEEAEDHIYGLRDKIPVGIFDGKCVIDFADIMNRMDDIFENLQPGN